MKDTSPGRFRRHRWPALGEDSVCLHLVCAGSYNLLCRCVVFDFGRQYTVCSGKDQTWLSGCTWYVLLFLLRSCCIFFICRNSFLRAIYLYKYCNRTAGSRTSDHCIHCCIFYSESHYSDYQHRSIHHHQCLSWLCFFSCTDQLFRVFLSDAPDRNLYYDSTCHCRILYYLSDFAKKREFDLKEGIEAHPPGCRSIPFTDLFSI